MTDRKDMKNTTMHKIEIVHIIPNMSKQGTKKLDFFYMRDAVMSNQKPPFVGQNDSQSLKRNGVQRSHKI